MLKRVGLVLAVTVACAATADARGPWTTCTGVQSGVTINGSVDVPDGARCIINGGSTVNGDIKVEGSLSLISTTVNGNIDAHGQHANVFLSFCIGGLCVRAPNLLNGDLAVRGSSVGSDVLGWNVQGSVTFTGNSGQMVVQDDVIGGDLVARGDVGADALIDSTVNGALVCTGDDPPPNMEGLLAGSYQGECAAV